MKFLFNKNEIYSSKIYLYQYNDTNFRICCQKYSKDKGFEKYKGFDIYKQIEEFMGLNDEKITPDEETRVLKKTSLRKHKCTHK